MSDNKNGSKYTFDSFAVTDANRTAFEKAKQFAENVDSKPLAIFGGTATGKTHLLYSVKNAIKQNNPELTVILTTTADMRSALADILNSGGTSEQFREKYLQADVLLVDDIQELAGKEAIQNELILIFNLFYESGKRFMMTSSQKEAGYGIQDRLVIREFCGDFAVITRAYIHARFEQNQERDEKRASLLKESEQVYWGISHDKEFTIESFKSYFKRSLRFFNRSCCFLPGCFHRPRQSLRNRRSSPLRKTRRSSASTTSRWYGPTNLTATRSTPPNGPASAAAERRRSSVRAAGGIRISPR